MKLRDVLQNRFFRAGLLGAGSNQNLAFPPGSGMSFNTRYELAESVVDRIAQVCVILDEQDVHLD